MEEINIPNPYISLGIFLGLVLLAWLIFKTRSIWMSVQSKSDRQKHDIEDILKQLFHVSYSGRKATLNAMAGALKMSDSRLFRLIEVMGTMQLIQVNGDLLSLTEEGKDYALRIIRVHRLWEKYLSEKTGISNLEWHDRAEKMEHTLTSEQADELYMELGSPRYDPHGDPIPTRSGEMIDPNAKHLSSVSEGQKVKIVHIEDEPKVIYQQILEKKLHMGQQLHILKSDDDQVLFESEGQQVSISPIVASNIGVQNLSKDETYEENKVRLSSLHLGEKARVVGISKECRGAARRRLQDLGFISGTDIEIGMRGPLKEPNAYLIRNTLIALRNDQADLILIEKAS